MVLSPKIQRVGSHAHKGLGEVGAREPRKTEITEKDHLRLRLVVMQMVGVMMQKLEIRDKMRCKKKKKRQHGILHD